MWTNQALEEIAKLSQSVEWRLNPDFPDLWDCFIAGHHVAWIEPRPGYCDRGHWKANCELPNMDHQDGFPRYYMSLTRAKAEMEDFLKWRLWKQRYRGD